eukprot:CAMPEP_0201880960 /NCGR_PEP_ID=MMETSP0902-20130614/11412_1 /ASSEMBLY_ACC=CAM_ASM_000551 /TAXON_ID=420261 /ORGANISM="Thalassiosira antarctica, Strain CCMP982" /LENGTH=52 /DNA_ID=CAMNT_0048409069 /DNA_START=49 /DNA_END=207 /DNA_ORIENTATION=-
MCIRLGGYGGVPLEQGVGDGAGVFDGGVGEEEGGCDGGGGVDGGVGEEMDVV